MDVFWDRGIAESKNNKQCLWLNVVNYQIYYMYLLYGYPISMFNIHSLIHVQCIQWYSKYHFIVLSHIQKICVFVCQY